MFGMKDINTKVLITSALLGGVLIFSSGCGGDSDSKKKTVDTNALTAAAGAADDAAATAAQDEITAADAAKTYTGNRTLTGSVDTSTLASSDRTLLLTSGRDRSRSTTATTSGTEVIRLYVVGSDGDLKYTGIECDGDSASYTCADIEGGVDYVVRYVKQLDNGKVLELRSTATVPEDSDPAPVKIDPITTMVAEAVVQAVAEAITGLISNEDLVQSIIASVKEAVETTMTTLIQTGVVSIPSMVADGDLEDIVDEADENENLADAAGTALTDESVTEALNSSKTDALSTSLTLMSKRQIIAKIFEEMMKGDGGGAPKWMINFIGDNWSNIPATVTVGWLQEQVVDALETDEYVYNELEHMGLSETEAETLVAAVKSVITTAIDDGTALDEAISAITEYHTIKAIAATARTEAQKEFLREFPGIVGELFPQDFLDTMDEDTVFQNSGQLTTYTIFLADIFIGDVTAQYMSDHGDDYGLEFFGDEARHMRLVGMEDPSFLFIALGFNGVVANTYAGIYFEDWAHIETRKIWDDTDNSTSQMLELYTGVENPAWFFTPITEDSVTSATLTYPTAGGEKTVDLDVMVEEGEFVQIYSEAYICTDDTHTDCSPNPDGITDHISGDYTVSITVNGVTASKTFEGVIVINDPEQYRPKLTTPREMPYCTEAMSDTQCGDLWTAFNAAGGTSVLKPNTDTDGNDENDSLVNAVFKWTAPDVSALDLPDNVKVAYQISISRYQTSSETEQEYCQAGNWEECTTELYSSWWDDRVISGTSFKLPITLPENSTSMTAGVNDEYNIGVNMVLVDRKTGRYIAEGGSTWSNFRVGEPPYTVDGTEPINLMGSITGTLPANAVVALLAESNEYNASNEWEWKQEVIAFDNTVTGGEYELNTTVADIKAQISNGKWFSIIIFSDADTDNDWDPWTPEAAGEDAWWMYDKWFWFETWGDFRVNTDDPDGNFETQRINDPSGVTVDGLDITID